MDDVPLPVEVVERDEPDEASFFFFTGDGVFIVKSTEVGEDLGLGRLF